ncbi:MAG: dihydroneopterin aldolase [Lactobacillus iners]|nr:dihydroneopterin aldolase [Lactobacillus iners]
MHNIVVYTHNGVFTEEKILGQRLEIDCEISYPIEQKVIHDNLSETISYVDIFELIVKYAQEQSFNLIETLANKLADKILSEYSMIISVQLKVRKYGVPMAGAFDDIEIEVFKKQK